jgi:hypothetical protein
LFRLAVTCSPFAYILVIYLTTVVLRAIEFKLIYTDISLQSFNRFTDAIGGTQVAHMAFSLLINIYATSVIALKAWCVIVGGL